MARVNAQSPPIGLLAEDLLHQGDELGASISASGPLTMLPARDPENLIP